MTTSPQSIYLDYNATAPVRPEVIARMMQIMEFPANASSVHRFGRLARKTLEDSRKTIAEFLNCWPNEVIFTASGTEANHLALRGLPERRVLASAVEHSSVLKASVLSPERIAVNEEGVVDLEALEKMLAASERPALVSLMLANNETGVLQPVREAAAICHAKGALLHCDAVQAVGKIPVDFTALGADMLSVSAHKSGGPVGAAALVLRNDLPVQPLLSGGGQELGRRAGTENIAAIAGFALACERADFSQMQQLRAWLDALEKECEALGGTVQGKKAARLPNTANIAMPGVGSEVQLMNFDLGGFAVSAGSACSSGRIAPSHVLKAMKTDEKTANSAIRVSGGWATAESDLPRFAELWRKTRLRLGESYDNQSLPGNS